MDAVVLGSDRTLEVKAPSLPFPRGSLSISSRARLDFPGPRTASPSPSSPRSISTFPVSVTPLKSAANAVLKLMSAVIAIAHVLFVSMKSLSFSNILVEYSFGKLKYDSNTLPMSSFLGSLPVSASKSLVSHAILIFFINKFSVRVSPTPTPRTKISIDVPVDRIPDIKSRLEDGMSSRPYWAAQEGSSRSIFLYFVLSLSTS